MAIFGRAKDQEAPQRAAIPDEPQAESGPGEPRSVVDERAFLLENTPEPRPFGLGLLDVDGLTLSENLVSDIDLPVYTAAQTAGWAVRAANLVGATPERPISLPVVASIPASGPIGDALIPGTAVAVEQGSPVPDGADAVIPAELGIPIEDGVSFPQEAGWPTNIVKIGSRIEDGDDLMAAGTELNPRQI
ncbi:MAG: hypothetical protein LBQ92_03345, partial [Propionibacteriaceae bacterium]|nr:hypothetical protein [Propionibacteriaceae bacterium]